jgi:hypothetical protein
MVGAMLVSVCAILASCHGTKASGPDLIVQPRSPANGELALFTGVFRYDQRLDCVYLGGTSAENPRVLPVWPHGYRAVGRKPVRIFNRDDEVVATEGKQFSVGGGLHALPGAPESYPGLAPAKNVCGVKPGGDSTFVMGEFEP